MKNKMFIMINHKNYNKILFTANLLRYVMVIVLEKVHNT